MSNIKNETEFIMKKYNIKANKSLGQNFLINDSVVEKIIESSNITKNDLIIEIGPGLGTLTKGLLEQAGKVICIELDKRMINILEDRFSLYDNFELINQDVLKVNLHELIKKETLNRATDNDYNKCKNSCKPSILYYNTNYYETIRRRIRFRKYYCYDTKRSGR